MHLIHNLSLFRAHLAELAQQAKALKRRLRARWTQPMADEQRELCRLKLRITELCALRALSRGKLHFRNRQPGHEHCPSLERCHARIAERLAPAYAAPQELGL
jgi:hypothetical protein